MSFPHEPIQPDFSPLFTSLANSRTQQSNNALYQTIFLLIKNASRSRDLLVKNVNDITDQLNQLLNASYLTANDESFFLVNARQLLAGIGVGFDDSVPHKRTIFVSPTGIAGLVASNALYDTAAIFDVYENEIYATLVNSSFGSTGSVGPAGPAGAAGPMGFAFDGNDGDDGFPYPGPIGPVGATGSTGSAGTIGPPGLDGESEYIEPLMYQGPPGATGATGGTGAQGNPGPPGDILGYFEEPPYENSLLGGSVNTGSGSSGSGGFAGTATIDFGAFPGSSDASVVITGQPLIAANSVVQAWIRPEATADHTDTEHMVETIQVFAGSIVAGTGFTIYAFNYSQVNEPVIPPNVSEATYFLNGPNNMVIKNITFGKEGQKNYGGGIGTRIYGQWKVAWRWS